MSSHFRSILHLGGRGDGEGREREREVVQGSLWILARKAQQQMAYKIGALTRQNKKRNTDRK